MASRLLAASCACACVLAALFSTASSSPKPQGAYVVGADVLAVLVDPLTESFYCDGYPYGYYADMDNNCQLFHVCYPIEEGAHAGETFQWTFGCGNGTRFDQQTLTCNHETDAFPCEESAQIWDDVNSNFGKKDEEF